MLTELVKVLEQFIHYLNIYKDIGIDTNFHETANELNDLIEYYNKYPYILLQEVLCESKYYMPEMATYLNAVEELVSITDKCREEVVAIQPDICNMVSNLCSIVEDVELRVPSFRELMQELNAKRELEQWLETLEIPEPPEALQAVEEQITLPKEFDTEEGHEILKKLEEAKLIARDETVYKWLGSSSLFGYFVLQASDKLELRHDNTRLPWKLYKKLFNVSDSMIKTAKNVISALKKEHICEPEGWDTVKKICK